jgi:hypothetical protein
MTEKSFLAPKENITGYEYLFEIEVALRELVYEELAAAAGSRWFKQRVPNDVRSACMQKEQQERAAHWQSYIPYQPLYYSNFSELRKIIEQSDNWSQVFAKIFGRKEVFVGTLSMLDPIRNRIAHNRRVSQADVEVMAGAVSGLKTCIGSERFVQLASRCSTIPDLLAELQELAAELTSVHDAIAATAVVAEYPTWRRVENAWWFDSEYLGCDLAPLYVYFQLVKDYQQLPRRRGTGHELDKWKISTCQTSVFLQANAVLRSLLQRTK